MSYKGHLNLKGQPGQRGGRLEEERGGQNNELNLPILSLIRQRPQEAGRAVERACLSVWGEKSLNANTLERLNVPSLRAPGGHRPDFP